MIILNRNATGLNNKDANATQFKSSFNKTNNQCANTNRVMEPPSSNNNYYYSKSNMQQQNNLNKSYRAERILRMSERSPELRKPPTPVTSNLTRTRSFNPSILTNIVCFILFLFF